MGERYLIHEKGIYVTAFAIVKQCFTCTNGVYRLFIKETRASCAVYSQ